MSDAQTEDGIEELEARIEYLEQILAALCLKAKAPLVLTKEELDGAYAALIELKQDNGIVINVMPE